MLASATLLQGTHPSPFAFPIMPCFTLLLLLLTYCSGSDGYATLTQPPSQSVSLGNSPRLTCSLSSEHQNYVVSWYQQRAGQAPRLLLYKDTNRASGIPDRFSGSKSGGERYLTIANVRADDEAKYYCGESEGSGSTYMYVFGGGTHLNVLGRPAVPPIVHVFPPSSEELKTKKTGTLVCLVDKFYPSAVQVTWTVDGAERAEGVETTRPTKQGDAYMASSYLTLSENDWSGHDVFVCKVAHDGKNYDKSVKRSECPSG